MKKCHRLCITDVPHIIIFAKWQKLFDLFQVHQVLRLQIQQGRSRVLGQGPLQRRHSAQPRTLAGQQNR
jgi:hypothetical protein